MDEMVWARENRLLKAFEGRPLRVALTGAVAISVIAGPIALISVGKGPHRSTRAVSAPASPSPSSSFSALLDLKDSFTPEGLVSYPTTLATFSLALFDSDGTVRSCLRGKGNLTLIGYSQRWISYTIGSRVVRRARCDATPDQMVDVAVALHDPKAAIRCAALSPNEDQLFVWAESHGKDRYIVVDPKKHVKQLPAASQVNQCRWIDERHLQARNYGDDFAIDVHSGKAWLLVQPVLWEGFVSPAGSAAEYQTYEPDCGVCPADVHVVDPSGDTVHSFSRGSISWEHQGGVSPWSPDGSRLVGLLDSGDPVLETLDGDTEEAIRGPLDEPLNENTASVGWLDTSTLWYATEDGVWVEDIDTHASVPLDLPGFHVNPNVAGGPTVLARATREGLRRTGNVMSFSAAPVYRSRALDISFSRPPSWTTDGCGCSIGPYKVALRVMSEEPPQGEGSLDRIMFAQTKTEASTAAAAIIHSFGADDPKARRCQDADVCATVTRSRVSYDGITFQRLDFGFYESAETILIATTARGTLILDFYSYLDDDDPSISMILHSLRVT
jgi:hypothetical protein